jgi:hypothetical protein
VRTGARTIAGSHYSTNCESSAYLPAFQDAIRRRDAAPFVSQGAANFGNAYISGGQAAAMISNVSVAAGVETVVVNTGAAVWDAGLETYARSRDPESAGAAGVWHADGGLPDRQRG